MKTITLTLTEEQAQQLLQQLLDPNNGNAYLIETAAPEEQPPSANASPVYKYKAMDASGDWYKYVDKPEIDEFAQLWEPCCCEHYLLCKRCLPSEIPADFTGGWRDSLMPM